LIIILSAFGKQRKNY